MSYQPRIYCIHPSLVWSALLEDNVLFHAAELGFDHILLAPLEFFPVQEADVGQICIFARRCKQNGLKLLIEEGVAFASLKDPFVVAHRFLFARASQNGIDSLPDPRKDNFPDASRRAAYPAEKSWSVSARTFIDRADQPVGDATQKELFDYRLQRLECVLDAGADGLLFRMSDIGFDTETWAKLMTLLKKIHPDARFLAWSDSDSAALNLQKQLAAENDVARCGFDAIFAPELTISDMPDHAYIDTLCRFRAIAPVITFPDSPFYPGPGSQIDNASTREPIYRRTFQINALCGDGVMMPMGFEYGVNETVSPVFSPAAFLKAFAQPWFDLSASIRRCNGDIVGRTADRSILLISAPSSPIALFSINEKTKGKGNIIEDRMRLAIVNCDEQHSQELDYAFWKTVHERIGDYRCLISQTTDVDPTKLAAAELRIVECQRQPFVLSAAKSDKQQAQQATNEPRVAIEAISPLVDGGRFPVKSIVGSTCIISADIFSDGHDRLGVALLWRTADHECWTEIAMSAAGNDRWTAGLPLERIGRHLFAIEAWIDAFATFRDELQKKSIAGVDVSLEVEEGTLLIQSTLENFGGNAEDGALMHQLLKQLQRKSREKSDAHVKERLALLLSEETADLMRRAGKRDFPSRSASAMIDVERKAAQFASWYELFPRSQSGDTTRHGTFNDVIERLPAIAAMGFDTLYFPPIHPIGRANRKGRNNSLVAGEGDPGSPYAIGSAEGGHTAIHPQLGTLADFHRLRDAAAAHGLELALDFAIQCAPDHPWLRQHPHWFAWRPDGSIRYAENPPKKYQDIVNVSFYAEDAMPSLWIALRDIVLYWVGQGVKLFRVDNPHTKPLPFWEWMIGEVRACHPDVIFLAEAFTRPKPMYRLAKAGFSQSYTYFTWRHSKNEFIDYMTELTTQAPRHFFRPHFFVNTPDINPYFLQHSGRPGFLIRAALAATLSSLWGMYSGFELCEAQALEGKEEYLHSEKFELRAWDWNRPGNIVREIALLNRIRRDNPALHSHPGIEFLPASDENILFFSKSTRQDDDRYGDNVLLIAINLDPFHAHGAEVELPLWRFGLPDHAALAVDDVMRDASFTWQGKYQRIDIDPADMPFSIWRIRPTQPLMRKSHV